MLKPLQYFHSFNLSEHIIALNPSLINDLPGLQGVVFTPPAYLKRL